MPVTVSLLHEAGSLVLMEGIETGSATLMATDGDGCRRGLCAGVLLCRARWALPAEDKSRTLFDHEGRQIGDNTINPRYLATADQRHSPVANQCITISIGSLVNGEMRVRCGDVNWRDKGPVRR